MSPPTVTAQAASRSHEHARAVFRQRTDEVIEWLATWPHLDPGDPPADSEDIHSQQNIVLRAHLNGQPVVVKVYANTAAHCATAEATALARYADFGLPVPDVVDLRTDQLPDHTPCTVLVLTRLPGHPLSTQLTGQRDLSTAAEAGAQVGRLLAVQHNAERHPLTTPRFLEASWQRVLDRYQTTLLDELSVSTGILAAMDHRSRALNDPPSLGWVTFDWRLRHLLWDGTTITGLVDLEYVKPYDSTVELANLLHDLTIQLDPAPRAAFATATRAAYEAHIPTRDRPTDERLAFCMARQALNHAAVKHWQGITDHRVTSELQLTQTYLDATSIADILHHQGLARNTE